MSESPTSQEFTATDRFGAEMKFELIQPTHLEENEGEMQYRIAYSIAFKQGVLPRDSMRKFMEEHGFWDDEDSNEMKDVMSDIGRLTVELQQAEAKGDKVLCSEVAKNLANLRMDMWKLFIVQQNPMMNSCEGFAETVKQESIMAACTMIKATGKRYWSSYKEYVEERDHNTQANVAERVIEIQMSILTESSMSNIRDLPEQKWIESLKDMDKQFNDAREEIKNRAREVVNKVTNNANTVETTTKVTKKSNTKSRKKSVAKKSKTTRKISKKSSSTGSS